MQTRTEPEPLLAELPLGLGLAFLALAMACSLSPSEDRLFLVGTFAAAGLIGVAVSIAKAWGGRESV
jgi:hypothetical protein